MPADAATLQRLRRAETLIRQMQGAPGGVAAHATTHEPGGSDPMAVDAAAGVGSLRTLGTGANQALPGNTALGGPPTAHATTHQPGGSDAMAVDAAAGTGSLRTLGTGAAQAAAGNDSRLSDSRTPTAHAVSHADGGTDEITTALDPRAYPMLAGTLAARPAAGTSGRFYWTTDEHILYRDNAVSWDKVAVADYADLAAIPATFAPSAHATAHEPGGGDAMAVDAAAGTGSLRTLGTAGTNAAAGNDSRIVNALDKTILDAKGDLIAASAADTPAKVTVGTDFKALVADSSQAAGLAYAKVPRILELTGDATTVVGTAYADAATGLNIACVNGVAVRFQFFIVWRPDAATTGARFSLNGPTATTFTYSVRWNTTATVITQSPRGASYDQAFTVGTDSVLGNSNIAFVEGLIVPTANGTLALRSAAEVASPGSVTVKAGSSVLYW